jgi:hypothetical protein
MFPKRRGISAAGKNSYRFVKEPPGLLLQVLQWLRIKLPNGLNGQLL